MLPRRRGPKPIRVVDVVDIGGRGLRRHRFPAVDAEASGSPHIKDEAPGSAAARDMVSLPAPALAQVAATGAAALKRWPRPMHEAMASIAAKRSTDDSRTGAIARRLRRLADPRFTPPEIVSTVQDAAPDLVPYLSRAAGQTKRYYLQQEVNQKLRLSSPQAAALRTWPGLVVRRAPSGFRPHQQYDLAQIDELEMVFREAVSLASFANGFQVPVYAVEQLVAARRVEYEDHPAIVAARRWRCLRQPSVTEFLEALSGAAARGAPPSDAISLLTASKRIGGREKPWAALLGSAADGHLRFWRSGSTPLRPASMLVHPSDLAPFDQIASDQWTLSSFEAAEAVSQWDTGELLNVSAKTVAKSSEAWGIDFGVRGRGLYACKKTVLDLAGNVAWSVEIGLQLGVRPDDVGAAIGGRARVAGSGWVRSDLQTCGLLPVYSPARLNAGG